MGKTVICLCFLCDRRKRNCALIQFKKVGIPFLLRALCYSGERAEEKGTGNLTQLKPVVSVILGYLGGGKSEKRDKKSTSG